MQETNVRQGEARLAPPPCTSRQLGGRQETTERKARSGHTGSTECGPEPFILSFNRRTRSAGKARSVRRGRKGKRRSCTHPQRGEHEKPGSRGSSVLGRSRSQRRCYRPDTQSSPTHGKRLPMYVPHTRGTGETLSRAPLPLLAAACGWLRQGRACGGWSGNPGTPVTRDLARCLPWPGDHTELLHHAKRVALNPLLHDVPIGAAHDFNARDGHHLARSGDTHEVAPLRPLFCRAGDLCWPLGSSECIPTPWIIHNYLQKQQSTVSDQRRYHIDRLGDRNPNQCRTYECSCTQMHPYSPPNCLFRPSCLWSLFTAWPTRSERMSNIHQRRNRPGCTKRPAQGSARLSLLLSVRSFLRRFARFTLDTPAIT